MKLAYTTKQGPVYRLPSANGPLDDRLILNTETEEAAERARRTLRGRFLKEGKWSKKYYPLIIRLNGEFYGIAGAE